MNQQKEFFERMSEFKFALLNTTDNTTEIHSRPMVIAQLEEDCTVWLVSGEASEKIREAKKDSEVSLTFQKDPVLYVVVNGTAEVIRDVSKAKSLWNESYRAWFPKGPEDPNLALIKITAVHGEYWDNSGVNRVKYAYEFAKAYLTGTTPDIRDGDRHSKASLV